MYGQNNGYFMPNYNPYSMQGNGAVPDVLSQMKTPYQQQQMIHQNQQQMQIPFMKNNNDMIWVLNENEATSYPVAPNNSVVLWDKNNPTIYVKSVNAQGMPSMRVLDFVERGADAPEKKEIAPKSHVCTCGDKFATKEQMNDLKAKLDDLTAKYEELAHPIIEKPKTTTKKAKESEE